MSIRPISTGSNFLLYPVNETNIIRQLRKQRIELTSQIQKINASALSAPVKQERVKRIEDQIQQIDLMIQQKQKGKLDQNNKD